jgi:hypothetical protein
MSGRLRIENWELRIVPLEFEPDAPHRPLSLNLQFSILNSQFPHPDPRSDRCPARRVLPALRCALAGLLLWFASPHHCAAAIEPVSIRSQSGQFFVRGLPLGRPVTGFPTSAVPYLRLDPMLTAVSLERIRQTLIEDTLGLKDKWRGLITVAIQPVQQDNPVAHVTAMRYTDGWGYRVDLPERTDKEQFINVAVRVMVAEIANRKATEREAELPPWLATGLSAELQAGILATLALEPAPAMDQRGRNPDPLRSVREVLRRRPALKLDELNMPAAEQLSGANAELYRACAHLFVHELLRLRGGRDALREMLLHLSDHLNWQTAFLRAFAAHFPRLIDVDKWYSLNVAHVSGRDLMSVWPLETTWKQLDEILATKVQVRLGANELPIDTTVTLQRIIMEWEYARQRPVLLQKVERLVALRPRAAPELVALVDGYAQVLHSYVTGRPPKFQPSPAGTIDTRRLPAAMRNLLQQLDELDSRRGALRERTAPAPKTG